jgi:ABC-type transport system involved in multi-copper enzyme maturation permease subunit
VLGKYLGLVALLALALGGMTALSTAYILVLGGKLNLVFFQAALLNFWKLLLVTALAVMLSALTSPILGAIIVFCFYVFGHATGVFLDLPPQFDGTFTKHFFEVIYYCVPNLDNFNLHSEAANDISVTLVYTFWAAAYGTAYSAVLLILACMAFEGKDL